MRSLTSVTFRVEVAGRAFGVRIERQDDRWTWLLFDLGRAPFGRYAYAYSGDLTGSSPANAVDAIWAAVEFVKSTWGLDERRPVRFR